MNFRIVSPASVGEDIGQVEVCVEQMNGELGEEIQVTVRTTPTGSTASGITTTLTPSPTFRTKKSVFQLDNVVEQFLL